MPTLKPASATGKSEYKREALLHAKKYKESLSPARSQTKEASIMHPPKSPHVESTLRAQKWAEETYGRKVKSPARKTRNKPSRSPVKEAPTIHPPKSPDTTRSSFSVRLTSTFGVNSDSRSKVAMRAEGKRWAQGYAMQLKEKKGPDSTVPRLIEMTEDDCTEGYATALTDGQGIQTDVGTIHIKTHKLERLHEEAKRLCLDLEALKNGDDNDGMECD